jgi:hypothetical protein
MKGMDLRAVRSIRTILVDFLDRRPLEALDCGEQASNPRQNKVND